MEQLATRTNLIRLHYAELSSPWQAAGTGRPALSGCLRRRFRARQQDPWHPSRPPLLRHLAELQPSNSAAGPRVISHLHRPRCVYVSSPCTPGLFGTFANPGETKDAATERCRRRSHPAISETARQRASLLGTNPAPHAEPSPGGATGPGKALLSLPGGSHAETGTLRAVGLL